MVALKILYPHRVHTQGMGIWCAVASKRLLVIQSIYTVVIAFLLLIAFLL